MSGSSHFKNASKKQLTPSLLRENLERKLQSIERLGERAPQPRAEFRGTNSYKVPYYESGHSAYGSFSALYLYSSPEHDGWEKPTKRIIDPQPPSRTGGVVGPEMDYSVRARNMPIIFIKQMKDNALRLEINGRKVFQDIFNILFTNRVFEHPSRRPKVGCSPTYHWTELQVKTWTEFAHKMGIQYHGKHEYNFPKGCLGKAIHGSYYSVRAPWPYKKTIEGREVIPYFEVPRVKGSSKRSELSRIKRGIARYRRLEVKPIDFSSLLVQRRIKSKKEIFFEYSKIPKGSRPPVSVFLRDYEKCLSLNTYCTKQVPCIVKDALSKLAMRVSKIYPDKPWIVNEKQEVFKPTYTVRANLPITQVQQNKLIAVAFEGDDDNVRAMYTTARGSRVHKVPGLARFLSTLDASLKGVKPGSRLGKFTLGEWNAD
jgi:hypothetical protein